MTGVPVGAAVLLVEKVDCGNMLAGLAQSGMAAVVSKIQPAAADHQHFFLISAFAAGANSVSHDLPPCGLSMIYAQHTPQCGSVQINTSSGDSRFQASGGWCGKRRCGRLRRC